MTAISISVMRASSFNGGLKRLRTAYAGPMIIQLNYKASAICAVENPHSFPMAPLGHIEVVLKDYTKVQSSEVGKKKNKKKNPDVKKYILFVTLH